jgi:hypothetical protein
VSERTTSGTTDDAGAFAAALREALKADQPDGMVLQVWEDDRAVVIDGEFNLVEVAQRIAGTLPQEVFDRLKARA